jgi:hypothetical protein
MSDLRAASVPPDTKDWTWVLERACPQCGFDPETVAAADIAPGIRDNAGFWSRALTGEAVERRPSPDVWSPTEYACHVRDVHRVFAERVSLMLTEDDPLFANWDQDETALAERYWEQDPRELDEQLAGNAELIARSFAAVRADQWDRPGRRSNGSVFTVDTFARYFLHDLAHHAWDVTGKPQPAR